MPTRAMHPHLQVVEIAKPEFKARMAIKLAVAGAFHTDFMAPAVPALEAVLKEVTVVKPRIPVISNVDAKTHSDPDVIKQILTKQARAQRGHGACTAWAWRGHGTGTAWA